MLYRVFPLLEGAVPGEPGGPLYVPRERQGAGRHDRPDLYGALYASRTDVAAVAERIQAFRGQTLTDADLRRVDGVADALVGLDDGDLGDLLDLDDANELARRDLRPSRVATRERAITRGIAEVVFEEGWRGFEWWSTLESSWTHVTLFAERAVGGLAVAGEPEDLTSVHPALRAAAEALGVRLT